ncbi:hypothetical protein H8D64_02195 [PVC group bacterium]|nr:hypothetical protein [PVC group bacterium]
MIPGIRQDAEDLGKGEIAGIDPDRHNQKTEPGLVATVDLPNRIAGTPVVMTVGLGNTAKALRNSNADMSSPILGVIANQ